MIHPMTMIAKIMEWCMDDMLINRTTINNTSKDWWKNEKDGKITDWKMIRHTVRRIRNIASIIFILVPYSWFSAQKNKKFERKLCVQFTTNQMRSAALEILF
jgi:hypothetical protein